MEIRVKLTDQELPCSIFFLDFLNRHISGKAHIADWHDQLTEQLTYHEGAIEQSAKAIADRVFDNPVSNRAVHDVYELLHSLMTGKFDKLEVYRQRYRFIFIVGAPRHGGSYLTKQLFRALGRQAEAVPDVVAHDGFPDVRPVRLYANFNTAVVMMHTLAEYLVMANLLFGQASPHDGKIIVPKKATKFAFHGAFFNDVFGPEAEYIVTLRHPIPACISTYEKAGGLPPDEKFKIRSRIEQWIAANAESLDRRPGAIVDQHYFDAYLRYWEHYHYQLALSGLASYRNGRVVVYGEQRMTDLAKTFFERFRSDAQPEKFHVFNKRDRHPEWQAKAEAAMRRVQAVWRTAILPFPFEELMEQW